MDHPSEGRTGNKTRANLFYTIEENLLVVMRNSCPVRDYLSVELMNAPRGLRAVRYGMCLNIYSSLNHMACLRPTLKL